MAFFRTAYDQFIKPNEGGYANHPADKGGETYAGIARAFHPTWGGWSIVDAKKYRFPKNEIPHNEYFPDIQFLVDRFYEEMWDRNQFSSIGNQAIANLLYDYYVNSGSYAIKAIQRLVGVVSDGVMGPMTVAAINKYADQGKLHDALKAARREHYEAIIKKDSSQSVFRDGWMARLARFPDLFEDVGGGIATILIGLAAVGLIFFLATREKPKMRTA